MAFGGILYFRFVRDDKGLLTHTKFNHSDLYMYGFKLESRVQGR